MKTLKKAVLRILLAILVLLLLAAAYLLIFHLNDIKALYMGFTTSTEEIENKIKENDKELLNTINDYGFQLSDEDIELLNKGTLSEEQMAEILLGNETTEQAKQEALQEDALQTEGEKTSESSDAAPTTDKKPVSSAATTTPSKSWTSGTAVSQPTLPTNSGTSTSSKPSSSQTTQSTSSSENDKRVAELVAKMYVLKSQYSGQVNGIVSSMKSEYAKLPSSQQTAAAKSSIASSYMNKISALEAQCDAQVNTVVTELRKVLSAGGKDTSLADSIVSAYAKEKENTKAYYVNKYSG